MKKRIMAILICAAVVLSLTGCGESDNEKPNDSTTTSTSDNSGNNSSSSDTQSSADNQSTTESTDSKPEGNSSGSEQSGSNPEGNSKPEESSKPSSNTSTPASSSTKPQESSKPKPASSSTKPQESSKPKPASSSTKPQESSKPTPASSSKPAPASSTTKPVEPPVKPSEPIFTSDGRNWDDIPYADEMDFLYENVDGGVYITAYIGKEIVLKIPPIIDGKKVVGVELDGVGFIDICIPASVTSGSYGNNSNLKSAAILGGKISNYAFNLCVNLESVTIASGVTEIGDYAFLYCPTLKSIKIPDSVTGCGYDVFAGCNENIQITFKGKTYKTNHLERLYQDINNNG